MIKTGAVLEMDNPFWRFSIALYGAEGVKDECLSLQERLNIDVNALLFAAWLGAARSASLSPHDLALIDAATEEWCRAVVHPLRQVRRVLKPFRRHEAGPLSAFAQKAARFELEAEQIEQAILFALADRRWQTQKQGGSAKIARDNVEAFVERSRANLADKGPAVPLPNFLSALPPLIAPALSA